MAIENWPLIMASMKIDFKAQMYFGHPVEIKPVSAASATVHSMSFSRFGNKANAVLKASPVWFILTFPNKDPLRFRLLSDVT